MNNYQWKSRAPAQNGCCGLCGGGSSARRCRLPQPDQSYAVARDVKEVPRQLREVLHDVENFQSLLAELLQEASKPQSKVTRTPAQSQRLITILKATASCSHTLSTKLNKVLPAPNDSSFRQAWRSLAILAREEDVLRECDRLQSLKQDLHIELQNVGVALINVTK